MTNAPGPGAGILAEVGYGLATVPYENWDTWTPMSYVGEVGNNDQYQAILTPEDRGQFRYLARFSTTLGREWTYARTADGRIPILTVRQSGDVVPPRTPENLRVVDWGATFISLEWDPVIDDPTLYAYDVFRSTTSGVVGPWVGRVLAPDTTFTDTSVTSGLTYFYVVQAVDTSFNRSGYSNEVEATAEAKLVNVTFEVTVPDWTPGGATVYIVGDIGEFCGWCNPQTVALNQINDITWSPSFSQPDGQAEQYKYSRGNWDINEWWGPIVGVNNRHMTVDYGTTGTQFIADDVPYWRDPLVIAHEPLDGAVDVDTSVAISVTLSRYLDPATIVADNLVVTNGTTTPTLDITWFHHTNMTATTIIMTPQAPLDPGTLYDVTLGTGLAGLNSDNEGIHLQQPYTWSFTTADAPIVLNEFSASTTGTDVEYVEALGAADTDYSAYTILEIEGDSGNTGVIDEVIAVGSTDASGFWLGDLAANTLENGSVSLLLVKNFTGAFGQDLDTDDDG
ncbi:MAG: Ig-like domain-containing protein, partial [Anaerolineae bacterium]